MKNMTRAGRKIVIAGGAALVLTAGASAATAAVMSSGPVDSSGVIHGCWSKSQFNGSHAFVLQDAGIACPRGTIAISWNMQGPAGSSRIDGGVVVFNYNGNTSTGTCTVLRSFGPDAVTVSYVTRPDISGQLRGCALSGLPASAGMQATPVYAGGGNLGAAAELFPEANGSTDVILSAVGPSLGASGEFNWLAVPSS